MDPSRHSRVLTRSAAITHDLLVGTLRSGCARNCRGLAPDDLECEQNPSLAGFPVRKTILVASINILGSVHTVQQVLSDRNGLKSATTGTSRILLFQPVLVGYSAVLSNWAASAWPRYERNRGLRDNNPAQYHGILCHTCHHGGCPHCSCSHGEGSSVSGKCQYCSSCAGFPTSLRPVSDVLTTRGNLCNHGLLWVRTNLVPHGFPGPLRSLVVL